MSHLFEIYVTAQSMAAKRFLHLITNWKRQSAGGISHTENSGLIAGLFFAFRTPTCRLSGMFSGAETRQQLIVLPATRRRWWHAANPFSAGPPSTLAAVILIRLTPSSPRGCIDSAGDVRARCHIISLSVSPTPHTKITNTSNAKNNNNYYYYYYENYY